MTLYHIDFNNTNANAKRTVIELETRDGRGKLGMKAIPVGARARWVGLSSSGPSIYNDSVLGFT